MCRVRAAARVVGALGILVLVGWVLDVELLKSALPGRTTMKINAALCFVLTAASLAQLARGRSMRWHGRAAAGVVAGIALLTFLQYLFGIDLGIDRLWIAGHASSNVNADRMALITCVAFSIAAATLLVLPTARRDARVRGVASTGAAVVAGIGAIGIVGYVFDLELLYSWYTAGQLAVHTAAGMVVLGGGLWAAGAQWREDPREEERIARRATQLLILVIVSIGISGFAISERNLKTILSKGLEATLQARAVQIGTSLDDRLNRTASITTDPELLRRMRAIAENSAAPDTRSAIEATVLNYGGHGFTAITLTSATGVELASYGARVRSSSRVLHLHTAVPTSLVWDGGVHVQYELPLTDAAGTVGSLHAEQYMAATTAGLMRAEEAFGPTAELLLCGPGDVGFECFPTYRNPLPMTLLPGTGGLAEMAAAGTRGERGLGPAIGRRGERLIAAYAPVRTAGLVALLSVDSAQIYQPLRRQFQISVLLILAVSIAAHALTRAWIRPPAALLEQQVQERTTELATAADAAVRQADELRRANEALVRSNMELQRFAYVASHDLQTPMRSVAGFVELLRETYGGRLDAQADDWIGRIVKSVRHLETLVRDLLEYSRIESTSRPFEPVALADVVDHARTLLDTCIRDSDAVITVGELPVVRGERTQLVQLMVNLLGNALKYRSREAPAVRVSAVADAAGWRISVRDNGIGIAPRHHERIFEVFQRLHDQREYPGTGIGLAVCRRVVHRHGGRMWVESAEGAGSTFHFTIARDAVEAA